MTETEIRRLVAEYLTGDVSLATLEEAVVAGTWESGPRTPETTLVSTIALLLADFDRGVMTAPELDEELRQVAGTSWQATLGTVEVTGAFRGWSGVGHRELPLNSSGVAA